MADDMNQSFNDLLNLNYQGQAQQQQLAQQQFNQHARGLVGGFLGGSPYASGGYGLTAGAQMYPEHQRLLQSIQDRATKPVKRLLKFVDELRDEMEGWWGTI